MSHAGDRYDGRDAESMRRPLPKCYGTAAYEECPLGRCPERDWCQLDYANGRFNGVTAMRRERTSAGDGAAGLARLPECPVHGGRMRLADAGTPEQEYCGTWYVCGVAGCEATVLLPSRELRESWAGDADADAA